MMLLKNKPLHGDNLVKIIFGYSMREVTNAKFDMTTAYLGGSISIGWYNY
jgi:hypothetical protein